MRISEEDHARIAAAVASAETTTSGEIRCVLAAGTENEAFSALMSAAIFAFILPPLAIYFLGIGPDTVAGLFGSWSAAHGDTAGAHAEEMLMLYSGSQAIVFALVAGLSMIRPLRRLMTPRSVLEARVRRAALEQFDALGLTHTRDATGVLIFASLADRRAEVLADAGIYEKTSPADWQGVADALVSGLARNKPTDGFVDAVGIASGILSRHFPRRHDDTNELPDGLVTRQRPK